MSDVTLKSDMIAICGPIRVGDNRESWLRRGARSIGISYRQAKSLFYGEVSDESPAVKVARAASALRKQEAEARDQHKALIARIEAMERRLAAFNQDVDRAVSDAAIEQPRVARRMDRPVDFGGE